MEEKNEKLFKDLLKKYQKDTYFNYKSDGWYDQKIHKGPTTADILPLVRKLGKNKGDIFMILENIPEDVIQEYLRIRKLAKIRKNMK